ncbi:MAG: PAS domain-containing protein [candidate division KSB1 bacterium]|nr:PAS domain-containing protein [candidate division KSB1 bacterium]MDZ7318263.1 PAS domain-containing protein [candidate division KSB1 bacterium]MDZ7340145.1 PAS domain-containing protein [candidate division KSB1 bacterium]
MNLLLIGFRYHEVKDLQDTLQVKLPQLKVDFAISVRDCWHRFKLSSYDFLLLDTTGSESDSMAAYQEIALHSEAIPIVVLADSLEFRRLNMAISARNDFLLIKDAGYATALVELLKSEVWQSRRNKSAFKLPIATDPKRSWQYFWAAMNINPHPLLIISDQFEIIEANDAFFDSFQYQRSQTVGKKCYEQLCALAQPCQIADGVCPLRKVQQCKSSYYGPCLCRKQSAELGSEIKIQALPIFNDSNQIDQVMINFQTPVKPHKAEMPSLFDRSLLDLMLSGLSDGLIFCNTENRIIFLNQTAEIILGMPKEKVVGLTVFDLPLGDGVHWLTEVLSTLNARARFNSIAFKTLVHQQLVQIRFAPVYGPGKLYMGGFLYLTELADLTSKEPRHTIAEEEEKLMRLKQAAFPKSIAEG